MLQGLGWITFTATRSRYDPWNATCLAVCDPASGRRSPLHPRRPPIQRKRLGNTA